MNFNKLFTILFISLTIISCSSDEPAPKGKFSKGVFIINEGNFSESNGSIGFYDETTKSITQDLFNSANGVSPGGILQSLYVHENRAFIIDQVGSVIHVVDANSFESIATIDNGLSTPRYMTINNGKGYVSNWGMFDENFNLNESYIAIIDLATYEVIDTVPVGSGAEALINSGSSVMVANSFSNTIEEVDTSSDTVVKSIEVAAGPTGFVLDRNNKLWVLTNSFVSGSSLLQLDLTNGSIIKSFEIAASAKSLVANTAGDQLYYLSAPFGVEAQIKKIAIDATGDSNSLLIKGQNLYGLGIEPTTDIIYVANSNAFQGNGTIIRYNQGEIIDSFSAGVGPNSFVFRK
jgi:YVTN family beta-propeller protein